MQAIRHARAVIGIVVGLMVLVSASSLVAALLLSIRRKRGDIAMLMALGADRRLIFWIFEYVGMRVGLAGVIGGLLLGAIFCAALASMQFPLDPEVYPLDHLPVAWRARDGLLPAAAALLICAFSSGPIARRAARTRPLQMLGQ
jgi:lipoprotein-releasing system permease protein